MRKRVVWMLALVVLAGLIGYSVYSRIAKKTVEKNDTGAVPVSVARPRRGEIARSLSYAGTLEPAAMVVLTSKVAGRVEQILVKEGEVVSKGQILVVMEGQVVALQSTQASSALRAAEAQYEKAQRGVRPEELQNAQASLAQAEKDFSAAEESYSRAERLYKEGTIAKSKFEESDKQYRAAQTQLENARRSVQMMEKGASEEDQSMAEANLQSAEAQRDLAQLQVDFTRVSSPIAGRIAKVMIDEGNVAQQSTPLLAVVQDDPMILRIPLPEMRYGEFDARRGSIGVRVAFRALPDRGPFDGRISSISPTIDPKSRTFTVEVTLPNRSGLLKAGMYASVDFVVERAAGALLLPTSAVVARAGRTGVFIADRTGAGGAAAIARFREIRVGIQDGESAEILEGVGEADWVVVEGNAFLEDGQAVEAAES
jgi:RND family efflux transporter MFP subunit